MSTAIRPELSGKNQYWIPKHRYYELKHFCLQYPGWEKAYEELDAFCKGTDNLPAAGNKTNEIIDPVGKCVEARSVYFERMQLLEKTAMDTDAYLSGYILRGVTAGVPYDVLKAKYDIPYSKDAYYEAYRKFFWLLDKAKL